MTAQHIINNIEFARKAYEIHDTIADSHLSRLGESLAEVGNQLSWGLVGGVAADSKPWLRLKVVGKLMLCCQRCLEPMQYDLDLESLFFLVPDEGSIPLDEDNLDDQEYLVADEKMQVLDLLEDEILLALPLAPKHDPNECRASGSAEGAVKPNPFDVLKAFKANKSQN